MLQPKIDINKLSLTGWQLALVANRKVVVGGRINPIRPFDGLAYYIWRSVVYVVSKDPEHQKTPVLLDVYLWDSFPKWRSMTEKTRQNICLELDMIAQEIIDQVPFEDRPQTIKVGKVRVEE